MPDLDTTPTRDPFWQRQIDLHKDNSGRHADPSACGTCRDLTDKGEQVQHDECAARATLLQPQDMPSWEVIVEMTAEEKANLPARFHLPHFDDCGVPNAWLCTVCWGDGWTSAWPCETALKQGTKVFTPADDAERHKERQNARLVDLELQIGFLEAKVNARQQQLDDTDELDDMDAAVIA